MSWQVFKDNVSRVINNPESIPDIDTVANILATEYDAAIKSGYDISNNISVQIGDVESMKTFFKAALLKGQTSTTPYDLVGELGNGVLAYWQKVLLNNYPIPKIPAPGTTSNIAITLAKATISGVWAPPVTIMANIEQPGLQSEQQMYAQLNFQLAGIDENSIEVQQIVNFNEQQFNSDVTEIVLSEYNADTFPANYTADNIFIDAEIATGQLSEDVADNINEALVEQKIMKEGPKPEDIKSGYGTLGELLKVADSWARSANKNARLCYSNWIIGYVKGIHGLCAMGVKCIVSAMLGFKQFATQSGNANDYSFKSGASESFSISVGGKKYYNDKVKITIPSNNGKPDWKNSYIGDSKQWQTGDIIAFDYTKESGKDYGHIQIWTGWNWVSDHTQGRVEAISVADFNTVSLWRLNDNGVAQLAKYSVKKV
jgi:hypothetical protein